MAAVDVVDCTRVTVVGILDAGAGVWISGCGDCLKNISSVCVH